MIVDPLKPRDRHATCPHQYLNGTRATPGLEQQDAIPAVNQVTFVDSVDRNSTTKNPLIQKTCRTGSAEILCFQPHR